jgi:hypothetical protein
VTIPSRGHRPQTSAPGISSRSSLLLWSFCTSPLLDCVSKPFLNKAGSEWAEFSY